MAEHTPDSIITTQRNGQTISLTELPLLFEKLKDGGTLGQCVPKSEEEKKEEN